MARELVENTEGLGYGAKMKALPTDLQRRFVQHMIVSGGKSRILCARDAGYRGDDATLSTTACRLMQDKRIQEAIVECARGDLSLFIPAAVRRLKEEVDNPQSSNGVKAAVEIMNRAGLHGVSEVIHTNTLDNGDRLQRLALLAKQSGLDLSKLVGDRLAGKVIDAEFTDVTPIDLSEFL